MQQNLADLIKSGESENLDFKQKITSLDKIAKTICSFANTTGGIILVGVKDNRSVTGIDPEEEKYMLDQAALNYCDPSVSLDYEEIEYEEDLIVLKVTIAESSLKPHSSLSKNGDWQVYIRQRDKSLPAGKNMVRLLRREPEPGSPKTVPVLDKNEIQIVAYLKANERITAEELASIFNFSRRRALRLLNQMVQKGLLRLFEHEKEDYYA